jgi:hypothetical protein
MTTLPTPWRKPSSLADSHGPELRLCGGAHVEIRHSREHAGPDGEEWFAAFSRKEFSALCAAVKAGEFDHLAADPDPDFPATMAGGHALIIEFGDEEALCHCQCGDPLDHLTMRPDQSLDTLGLRWERHVMSLWRGGNPHDTGTKP